MSNLLAAFRRPAVIFDVENKQHRRWAHKFLLTRNWGQCPVMFILPQGEDNVISLVNRELGRYYLGKEFGRVPQDEWTQNYRRLVAELPHVDIPNRG